MMILITKLGIRLVITSNLHCPKAKGCPYSLGHLALPVQSEQIMKKLNIQYFIS